MYLQCTLNKFLAYGSSFVISVKSGSFGSAVVTWLNLTLVYTAPIIKEINMNFQELTVNSHLTNDTTIMVDLPHVSDDNGPFRLVSVCNNNFTNNLYNM